MEFIDQSTNPQNSVFKSFGHIMVTEPFVLFQERFSVKKNTYKQNKRRRELRQNSRIKKSVGFYELFTMRKRWNCILQGNDFGTHERLFF